MTEGELFCSVFAIHVFVWTSSPSPSQRFGITTLTPPLGSRRPIPGQPVPFSSSFEQNPGWSLAFRRVLEKALFPNRLHFRAAALGSGL